MIEFGNQMELIHGLHRAPKVTLLDLILPSSKNNNHIDVCISTGALSTGLHH